jgi:hypothetical protein
MGGSKHKKVTQAGRPSGKAFKQHPKEFNYTLRRLVTSLHFKGQSGA